MKTRIFLLFASFAALFIVSCNTSSADAQAEQIAVASHEMEMKIEGMTCQSGCKKLIEKKMAQAPGVVEFSIDFEQAVATVVFDGSITDASSLEGAVADINNGAYSASAITETLKAL
jgi:mercuric ion binding protein